MTRLKETGKKPTIEHLAEALRDWVGNNNANRKTASGSKEPIQSDTFWVGESLQRSASNNGRDGESLPRLDEVAELVDQGKL